MDSPRPSRGGSIPFHCSLRVSRPSCWRRCRLAGVAVEAAADALFSDLRAAAAERRRTERGLRQTEVFYHSLVETIPQMILCKDLDGRFTFANQKFCAELGTTIESIKGKTDFDFFPKQLAEKYRRDDKQVIESGQVLDVVEEHVTPKGDKLYVQVMKTPLYGPDGKAIGIQGIFWDVTERLRPRNAQGAERDAQ